MPFVPDNSVPGLSKKERTNILIKRAQENANNANVEAARAKQESGFANTIVRLTGMGKTADTFARYGSNKMSSPEARQFSPMPTRGEMAGAIGNTALLAYPGSTVAKGVTGVAGKVLGSGAAKLAGSVASLGGAGYGFDVSSNLLEGKTGMEAAKPGFGTALGAIPLVGAGASAAKGGIQKIGAKQAPRIINSLIKPLQKDFAYGKNPGRAVAEAGIKANSFEELVTKISQSRQKAGQEIGDLGKKLEGKVVLNLQDTLLPINDAMETAAKQNNATLLQRLNSVKQSITEMLGKGVDEAGNPVIVSNGARNLEAASFKDAREMMRSIGDVTAFTGNPSDDKLVNSALKRVYGKMKERTLQGAEAADPAIAKMFRKATEKYSDLTSAEIAAKYRDKILERQNIMSFGQTTVGLGGALATAIATGGAAVPTILAGMGAAGLQKALSSTTFKTRLAAWLAKVPASEKGSILQRFPQLQSVVNTRTPGDVFLDSKLGGKLKEGVKNMKGKGGLSLQDVTKQPGKAQGNKRGFGTGAGRGADKTQLLTDSKEKLSNFLKGLKTDKMNESDAAEFIKETEKMLKPTMSASRIKSYMEDVQFEIDKVLKERGKEALKGERVKSLIQSAAKATDYASWIKKEGLKASDTMKQLYLDAKRKLKN